jgi:hypothetical protein
VATSRSLFVATPPLILALLDNLIKTFGAGNDGVFSETKNSLFSISQGKSLRRTPVGNGFKPSPTTKDFACLRVVPPWRDGGRGAPASGISQNSTCICLPARSRFGEGRGIFEQPKENHFFSNLIDEIGGLKIHPFVKGPFYHFCCNNIEHHNHADNQKGRHWQRLKT